MRPKGATLVALQVSDFFARPEHASESAMAVPQRFGSAGNFINAYIQFFADFPVWFAPRKPLDDLPSFHNRRELPRSQNILEKCERIRAPF